MTHDILEKKLNPAKLLKHFDSNELYTARELDDMVKNIRHRLVDGICSRVLKRYVSSLSGMIRLITLQ